MNEKIIQTDLDTTERQKISFGFSSNSNLFSRSSLLLGLVALILFTQLIRFIVLHFDQKFFLNEKFAFSLDIPITIIYILYFIVFTLITNYLRKHWNNLLIVPKLGFIFILAGGLANLGERMYFGYVVDYIFILNGVLNLADLLIFLGVILVITSRTNSEKL